MSVRCRKVAMPRAWELEGRVAHDPRGLVGVVEEGGRPCVARHDRQRAQQRHRVGGNAAAALAALRPQQREDRAQVPPCASRGTHTDVITHAQPQHAVQQLTMPPHDAECAHGCGRWQQSRVACTGRQDPDAPDELEAPGVRTGAHRSRAGWQLLLLKPCLSQVQGHLFRYKGIDRDPKPWRVCAHRRWSRRRSSAAAPQSAAAACPAPARPANQSISTPFRPDLRTHSQNIADVPVTNAAGHGQPMRLTVHLSVHASVTAV